MNLRLKSKASTFNKYFTKGDINNYDIAIRAFGGTETRYKKDGLRSDKHFGRCYKRDTPINGFYPNITEDYVPCVLIKCFDGVDVDEVFDELDKIDFIYLCDYMSTPSLSYWEVVHFFNLSKEKS